MGALRSYDIKNIQSQEINLSTGKINRKKNKLVDTQFQFNNDEKVLFIEPK